MPKDGKCVNLKCRAYNFRMAKHPDVAIVGGGIIGLSCAYFLARAGFSVEVFDRGDLGKEASWAGAGILPPGNVALAATAIDKLRAIGSARFPEFSAELRELTGIDNGYVRCGGIEFLEPHDTDVLDLWRREGIAFERLSPEGLKHLEPEICNPAGEPVLLPECGQVRNPWHMRALIAVCEKAGVRLRPNVQVTEWIHDGTRIGSVRLGDGESVSAKRVLLAAGAWSEEFLKQLGCQPGVHPVRGQIVLMHHPRPVPGHVLMSGKRYLVPRGDGLVLVGSTEEPEAGFEKVNTEWGVTNLNIFAYNLCPTLRDARIEKCWAGLRPGSPDGLPFIGQVPGWDNVYAATGHFRAGVQLSIGTAQLITELFTGKPSCVPLEAFAIDRKPHTGGKTAFRS
jgi:glycine oxidase